MASITLTFSAPLNVSCQVGDIAYAVDTSPSGSFTTNGSNSMLEIGEIREINNASSASPTVICATSLDTATNVNNKFILFSKGAAVNLSSILGYYAETKFVCDDLEKAELFSIGTDVFESSK
jgi:hypothetical protein